MCLLCIVFFEQLRFVRRVVDVRERFVGGVEVVEEGFGLVGLEAGLVRREGGGRGKVLYAVLRSCVACGLALLTMIGAGFEPMVSAAARTARAAMPMEMSSVVARPASP